MDSNIKKTEQPMPPELEEKLDKVAESSDYMRGYRAGKRYYERGPVELTGHLHFEDVPDEIVEATINWFVNYNPIWGVTLKNNKWQYLLAQHFYNLGVAHEREAILKLREEAMMKYDLERLKAAYPLTPDECFKPKEDDKRRRSNYGSNKISL